MYVHACAWYQHVNKGNDFFSFIVNFTMCGTKSAGPTGCRTLMALPEDYAWVQTVYDLSYLHHGSIIRRPKLPITTHFADRLAYLLASAGEDGAEWDRSLVQGACKSMEGTRQDSKVA